MLDSKINETLRELEKIIMPEPMERLRSHLMSLERQIEDLRKSRDNWKNKFMEMNKK